MSEIDQGGFVYPSGEEVYNGRADAIHPGITLRQHYAGIAMQGYLANSAVWHEYSNHQLAKMAYEQADAMIEAGKS